MMDCAGRTGPDLVNLEIGRGKDASPYRIRNAFSMYAMKLDNSDNTRRLLQEHLDHTSFNTTAKYRNVTREEHRKSVKQNRLVSG